MPLLIPNYLTTLCPDRLLVAGVSGQAMGQGLRAAGHLPRLPWKLLAEARLQLSPQRRVTALSARSVLGWQVKETAGEGGSLLRLLLKPL